MSPDDHELYLITDDVDEAVAEIDRFWRNYHSIRWVGDRLVIRLRHAPTDDEVGQLNDTFADLLVDGSIEAREPLARRGQRQGPPRAPAPRHALRPSEGRTAAGSASTP